MCLIPVHVELSVYCLIVYVGFEPKVYGYLSLYTLNFSSTCLQYMYSIAMHFGIIVCCLIRDYDSFSIR